MAHWVIYLANWVIYLAKWITAQGNLIKERTASLYNAQRKVKALKQQLEQKELQMNLQRQKVAALEERITRLNQVLTQGLDTFFSHSLIKK